MFAFMNWDSIFFFSIFHFIIFISDKEFNSFSQELFLPSQYFKKLDYVPRSGLYDAVNCTAHASDLRKYDERIKGLNEYVVVDVARDKLAEVKLRKRHCLVLKWWVLHKSYEWFAEMKALNHPRS